MNHKRTTISIALATLMLVSLFAVVSSAASVSGQASGTTVVGQTMAGTGPAATYGEAGIPVLVAVDTSGQVWCMLPSNSGGGWTSIGGSATSSPTATIPYGVSDNLAIDVFVRGTDGAIWYKTTANNNGTAWSGWMSLGGQIASGTGPAACSWSAGRLDVFVEGTNGALWHKWTTNSGATWSGWESLGGKLTASPAATWWVGGPTNHSIQVFARGSDGAVWQKYWNGSAWSSWHSLGGQLASGTGPAVSQDLNLFVQGTDGQLWHKSPSSGSLWTAWSTLAGAPPEALSAASPASVENFMDHTGVSVSSTSGNVWYSVYDLSNPNFGQWTSAGAP
jgi:hypothetical protein